MEKKNLVVVKYSRTRKLDRIAVLKFGFSEAFSEIENFQLFNTVLSYNGAF